MGQNLINEGFNLYIRNFYADPFRKNIQNIKTRLKDEYSEETAAIDDYFIQYDTLSKYAEDTFFSILKLYDLSPNSREIRRQFETEVKEKIKNKFSWIDSNNLERIIDVIRFQSKM